MHKQSNLFAFLTLVGAMFLLLAPLPARAWYPDAGPLWVRHTSADDIGALNTGQAVTIDDTGDVIAGGVTTALLTGDDMRTIKYDAAGLEQWNRRDIGRPPSAFSTSDFDVLDHLVVNHENETITVGRVTLPGGSIALQTTKYAPDGTRLWYSRFGNSASGQAVMGLDSEEDVICGVTLLDPPTGQIRLIKYREDGTRLWTKKLLSSPGHSFVFDSLAVCPNDDIVVVGTTTISSSVDIANVYRFSKDGNLIFDVSWTDVPPDFGVLSINVAAGPDGSIYLLRQDQYRDFKLIALSSTGSTRWTYSVANTNDVRGLGVDKSGAIFVAGYTDQWQLFVDKFSGQGTLLWQRQPPIGGVFFSPNPDYVRLDGQGNVYVGGIDEYFTAAKFFILSYGPNGDERMFAIYGDSFAQGPNGGLVLYYLNNLFVTPSGYVAATGSRQELPDRSQFPYSPPLKTDFITLEYAPATP